MEKLYDSLMEMVDSFDRIKICELELPFDDILNEDKMADIDLKGVGLCYIYVYNNEGDNIPHFHLQSKDKKGPKYKLDCAIKINENRYFDHGIHKDTLNSKQIKELKAKLEKINPETENTYWKDIQNAFYNNFPNCTEKRVDEMPDYSNIKLYKEK